MKGQSSVEFLVIVSVLFSIFLIFYIVYLDQNINLFLAQETIGAMRNSYALSSAINYVHLAGDGAQLNFTLTGRRNNETTTISDLAVLSDRSGSRGQAPLLTAMVNTTAVDGRELVIKNEGGEIRIDQ
jgi:hypothetical protein